MTEKKRLVLAGATLLAGLFIAFLMIAPLSINEVAAQEPDPTSTPEIEIQLPPLPDLIVSSISVVPDPPGIDQAATIYVGIKNVGPVAVPTPGTFHLALYIDPETPPTPLSHNWYTYTLVNNAVMPAYSGEHIEGFTFIFTQSKVYNIYALVDTEDHITESNEFNNVNTFRDGAAYPAQPGGMQSMTIQNHQQWQDGIASNLDLSNPKGVIRLGMFRIPYTETSSFVDSVYYPDYRINPITAAVDPAGVITMNRSIQEAPIVVGDDRRPNSTLYAAWVDSLNADPYGAPPVYDHQIYVARSCDGGLTWQDPTQVAPTVSVQGQSDPDLYLHTVGGTNYLFLVWADDVSGDGDIYFSSWSGPPMGCGAPMGWLPVPVNITNDPYMQRSPSVVAADFGGNIPISIVWEDYRNGNADVYYDYSPNLGTAGSWTGNRSVTDNALAKRTIGPVTVWQDADQVNPAAHLDPNSTLSPFPVLYVVWEDWRTPSHPEIYATWAPIGVYDFDIDTPLDIASPGTHYRIQPSVVSSTTHQNVFGTCADGGLGNATCVASLIHVGWEEVGTPLQNSDVYYSFAKILEEIVPRDACRSLCPIPPVCEWPYNICFEPTVKINGWVIESDYALPPNDTRTEWAIEPSVQKQVRLSTTMEDDFWYCGSGQNIFTYTGGVYITWADPRSYDNPWRQEVYFGRVGHLYDADNPPGDATAQTQLCPLGEGNPFNFVVNDNAKLYKYRDDLQEYVKPDIPPASVRQRNPMVTTFFENNQLQLGIAWDDDRWEDPLTSTWPANYPNQDVYFARWGVMYCRDNNNKPFGNCGVYISRIYKSPNTISATWRSIHWNDVTFLNDDITLQTRLGHTNTVNNFDPVDTWGTGGWQLWAGNPSSNYLGCDLVTHPNGGRWPGCEYDMSGRQIVDQDGNLNPASEYIQFKINIRGYYPRDVLSAVSRLVIRYTEGLVSSGSSGVYLPVILKNSS